ncbi:hypothetical protein HK104_008775, partial [Borealophlyctis nickersoniae]
SVGSKCTGTLTPSRQSQYWVGKINHNGKAPFNPNPNGYQVYRNVKDFGAKGDGVTDDTAAINQAISSGNRCGLGCDSATNSPALVYFPPGTYVISSPIVQYYFTQLVGDAVQLPVLKAAPGFKGMAVIDSNPYANTGNNWYTNQNNFFRQIRNFVIDTTGVPAGNAATGIHWQVAQATSLNNIVFRMSSAAGTVHQGIWMENGSGGFMSDLVFEGGKYGMWVGNQQFTSRNMTFRGSDTAIYVNWNWGWTFKNVKIENSRIGLDMSAAGDSGQGVGSIVLLDSSISNTQTGVLTGTDANSSPRSGGTLVMDNVRLAGVPKAVARPNGSTVLQGPPAGQSSVIDSWGQGQLYNTAQAAVGQFTQGNLPKKPVKSAVLLDNNGDFFTRPRPQYEQYGPDDFINVKDVGAKGDGQTDDTAAVAAAIAQYAGCKIIYFPAGDYVLSNTVYVPPGSRITGETWSVIMATGSNFQDQNNPRPMFKVGNPGDAGVAEITDIIFATKGPVPGAILVEWNMHDPAGQKGVTGMWDAHFRVGGALGTKLGSPECKKGRQTASPECTAAFALLHLTKTSSAYLENVWGWTADHDFDNDHSQISIYNGRGILTQSQGPVWMLGTASEHNVLYQYSVAQAQNIFMTMLQTETPYYQAAPPATSPFTSLAKYSDPTFSNCTPGSKTCPMAWGLRVVDSSNIYIYGAGHYNFFQNYDQTCLNTEDCQDAMVDFQGTNSKVWMYNLNTKASVSMLNVNGNGVVQQKDNRNGFTSTIMGFLGSV